MNHNSLEYRVRDLIGQQFDQQRLSKEPFAATRTLQVSAIPGPHGNACGAILTLLGTPTRGMVAISDLSHANGVGVDVMAGTAMTSREVALVRQFVAKAAQCALGRLPSDFTWSSASVMPATV